MSTAVRVAISRIWEWTEARDWRREITFWGGMTVAIFLGLTAISLQYRANFIDAARVLVAIQASEVVTKLEDGNSIRLKTLPVPETVEVIVNGVLYDLAEENGLRLDRDKIIVSDVEGGMPMQKLIRESIGSRGVRVKYLKRS